MTMSEQQIKERNEELLKKLEEMERADKQEYNRGYAKALEDVEKKYAFIESKFHQILEFYRQNELTEGQDEEFGKMSNRLLWYFAKFREVKKTAHNQNYTKESDE